MLKKSITKKEYVYNKIRKDIISGEYKPSERLIITKLAKRLNVSQIPVREALQQLASEGYVDFLPHSGAMVKPISLEELREIFEIRITLEALATELAINNISNANIEELEEILKESESVSLDNYGAYNRKFHEQIYLYANNKRLLYTISDLWDNSRRYPNIFQTKNEIEKSIKEHWEILDAIKKRDAKLAKELMKEHKTNAYKKLVELISEQK